MVKKEIVVVVDNRVIERLGAGGGDGGTELVDARVKVMVPSGFNAKLPTTYAAPVVTPVKGSTVPIGHD